MRPRVLQEATQELTEEDGLLRDYWSEPAEAAGLAEWLGEVESVEVEQSWELVEVGAVVVEQPTTFLTEEGLEVEVGGGARAREVMGSSCTAVTVTQLETFLGEATTAIHR